MKGKIIFLLTMFIVLIGLSNVYAAEDVKEDDAEDVVTLEQAVKLAYNNSRSLTKYEISKQKAEYQLDGSEDQYRETNRDQDSNMYKYNNYNQMLQDELEKPDPDDSKIDDYENKMEELSKTINAQSDTLESMSNNQRGAEDNYDDAVVAEENYQKQLEFIVEELYATILIQDETLLTLNKEYSLKLDSLNIEKAKLQLGRSSQPNVDQLSMDVTELNKQIIELNSTIHDLKGELNDMMGRKYDDELSLAPFEIEENVEMPEYDALLSKATRNYEGISVIKRDISNTRDDLDRLNDSDSEYDVKRMEIKEKELQLEDEQYNLKEAINNLITQVESKQEEYQLSLINYKNAQKNYEWDKKRFEMGQISKLDLIQSELDCLNAKDRNVSSGYSFYLAYRSLQLAEVGIL